MISYHPSPEMLSDYARGILDSGATLVVAAHVHACAVCRLETELWESVGGALLEDEAPASLAPDALTRALARLNTATPGQARKKALPRYLERFALPPPVQAQEFGRRLWVTPNIWFVSVVSAAAPNAPTYLVHTARNTTLPRHTHSGQELTVVLHGSFCDHSGPYEPGDFAQADDSILHAPAATGPSDCLCLVAAAAPARLVGRIARAIQALTGRFY